MIDKLINLIKEQEVIITFDESLHNVVYGIIDRELHLSDCGTAEEPECLNKDCLILVI